MTSIKFWYNFKNATYLRVTQAYSEKEKSEFSQQESNL